MRIVGLASVHACQLCRQPLHKPAGYSGITTVMQKKLSSLPTLELEKSARALSQIDAIR